MFIEPQLSLTIYRTTGANSSQLAVHNLRQDMTHFAYLTGLIDVLVQYIIRQYADA